MEEKYYSTITDKGLEKEAKSHKKEGKPLRFGHIAVGDGIEPEDFDLDDELDDLEEFVDEQAVKLKNELYRAEVNRVYIDKKNEKHLVVEALIPEDIGGFYIREVGVFDQDGDLFAIARYPETYKPKLSEGTAKDLYIRMILVFSSTPNISLSVDNTSMMSIKDTVDFAKVADVETLTKNHAKQIDDLNKKFDKFVSSMPSADKTFKDGCPVGTIFAYCGYTLPTGFLALNGKSLGNKDSGADHSGNKYKALYIFLLTNLPPKNKLEESKAIEDWQSGKSIILPNLRGRAIIGAGKGEGLTHRNLLSVGGEENHTLSVEEMPSHIHKVPEGSMHGKGGNMHPGWYSSGDDYAPHIAGHSDSLATGGGQPHNNMPPFIALN